MRSSPIQVGSGFYRTLALGNNSTMAIDPYGTLIAWGENLYGQIGTNSITNNSWTQLSNGDAYSLALRSDKTLWAWGLNTSGQLGVGDTIARQSPIQISGSWSQISAGASHTVAVKIDTTLYSWGNNTNGQLGDGTIANRSSPVQVGAYTSLTNANAYSVQLNGTTQYITTSAQTSSTYLGTDDFTIETWVNMTSYSPTQTGGGTHSLFFTRSSLQYLSLFNNSSMNIGTSDFTIEGWIRSTVLTSNGNAIISAANAAGNTFGLAILNGSTGLWQLSVGDGTNWAFSSVTFWTDVPNTWKHFAISRTGGTLYAYVDGSLVYSTANSTNIPTNYFQIGSQTRNNRYFDGYMSNIRVVIGTGLYSGSTMIPSTKPLIAVTNTKLLIGQNSSIVDNSGLSQTITNNAAVLVSSSVVPTTITDFSSIVSVTDNWAWAWESTGGFNFMSSTTRINNSSTGVLNLNAWYHIAIQRISGTISTWVNGVNTGTNASDTTNFTSINPIYIGRNRLSAALAYFPGYISNLRIIKGQGIFSGTFTPSINPLTNSTVGHTGAGAAGSLTGTVVLLTLQNQLSVTDNSATGFTFTLTNSPIIGSLSTPFINAIPASAIIPSAINAGNNFSLAIKTIDNSLWTWGLNTSYQLGTGTIIPRSIPAQVGTSSWTKISAGGSHILAIDTNNKLYGWGNNISGQLGLKIFSWTQLSSGNGFSMATRNDGRLYTWGTNPQGQLGQGDTINRSSPVQVGTSSWTKVSAGQNQAFAITVDGKLWSWGFNNAGQLGDTTVISRSSPVQVAGSWSSVYSGASNTLGIKTDSTLWGWGLNNTGQLGDGSTTNRNSPTQVIGAVTSWSSVSTGGNALGITGAISTAGLLYLWGASIINGTSINRSEPVQLGTSSWSVIAAGLSSMAGIDANGRLYTWGNNQQGELGDNSASTVTRSSPVQLGSSSWITVAAAAPQGTMAGITTTNTLFTWGNNSAFQLGDGSTVGGRSSMVQIGAGFIGVAIGNNLLALENSYNLFSWGNNTQGQLGLGDTVTRSFPTQIATTNENLITDPFKIGDSSWSIVSAGYSHSLAVTSDNRLFSWGNNSNGQLGVASSFVGARAGWRFTSLLRSDGTLWSIGWNGQSQIGDNINGTIIAARSSPVQVGSLSTWSKITQPSWSNFAIDNLGKLYAWGTNVNGSIGDNTTVNRSSPVQIGTSSWSMVVTNLGTGLLGSTVVNTYAIRSDGALFAWGDNLYGQLGTNINSFQQSSPVQIGTSSWSTVSAGSQYVMAITSTGKLFGWGRNTSGQLGITPSTFSWTQVNSSGLHTLAIRSDSQLFAWGFNTQGQLGSGDTINRSSPVQVASGSYTQISAGLSNSYAIRSDGSLWSWGDNSNGQLGQGIATTIHRSSPVQVGSSSWSTVSASKSLNYVIATTSINNLFAWGLNSTGQLGVGDFQSRSSPVQVSGGGSWTAISAGGGHSLGINSDFKLYTWGLGNIGQTAQAGTTFSWTQVATGNLFSLAIRSDGMLFAWGFNNEGETGDGSIVSKSSPVQIGASSWSQIAAGNNHVLAIRVDGTLWSWGWNVQGQLGLNDAGAATPRSSPVQIGTSTNWSKVAAGNSNSFAINTSFGLYAWGNNTNGVLGVGDTLSRSSPVQVATPVVSWSQVAAGASFTGGIDVLGRLYTWGFNTQGQLGGAGAGATTGSIISRSSPSQVGASSWSFVAAGFNAMAGITSAGNLFTWGNNSLGELGDNNLVAVVRSSPVQVGTSTWSSITASSMNSAGGGQMLAITTANVLWGWGQNVWGSLGDGTTVAKSSMVAVTGGGTYVRAYAGPASLAITTTTFSLQGWGNNNTYGAVGDNTVIPRSAPVQIGTSIPTILSAPAIIGNSSWTNVSAGGSHSTAIRTDGGLFTWGLNINGQLGLNDTVSRSSPVQVGTSSWVSISAGGNHTLASRYGDNQLFAWGFNTQGQLGSGVTTARSSPVQVNSYSTTTTNALTFNGSSQYLNGPTNTPVLTTGMFTIEAWINLTNFSNNPTIFGNQGWNIGQNIGFVLRISSAGVIQMDASAGVFNTFPSIYTGTNTVALNAWTHIAITRDSSNVIRSFINGAVDPTTATVTQSLYLSSGTTSLINIGGRIQDGAFQPVGFTGQMSNLRIVPRIAVYTTTFTPPSTALTATQSAGTNIAAITGIPNNGYSVLFGTANSHLTVPYNAIFDIPASTQWTLECWVYTSSTNVFVIANRNWAFGSTGATWAFFLNGGVTPSWGIAGTGSATYVMATSSLSGTLGQWNHYAFTRDAANLVNIWVNGVSGVSRTDSQAMTNASGAVYIGVSSNLASPYANGHISNLRIVNGQALYTGTFTPSTSPLTTTSQGATASNVGLLTCQSSTIIDNSIANAGVGFTITNVNTAIVTLAYSPFGTQATILVAQGPAVTSDNSINAYTFTNVASVTQVTATPFIGPITGSSSSAGASTSAAVGSTGSLFVWGLNANGQVGDNTVINRSATVQIGTSTSTMEFSPIQVGNSSWSQVSTGDSHSVGIKTNNTVFAWGLNSSGQLGDVSVVSRSSPVQVGTVTSTLTNANAYSTYVASTVLGYYTTPANSDFALGDTWTVEFFMNGGSPNTTNMVFASKSPAASNYTEFFMRSNFIRYAQGSSVYLCNNVSLYDNIWHHIAIVCNAGELKIYVDGIARTPTGTSTTTGYNVQNVNPFYILNDPAPSTATNYSGYISNLRIVKGTAVYTSNFTVPLSPLTAITNTVLLTFQNTTVVDNSSSAKTLTPVGTIIYGSLNTPFTSAVAAGALFATQISAGAFHSAAIDTSNKLYMWGFNSGGELGLNDVASRSAPTQIGIDTIWNSVSAGLTHTVATNSRGDLFVWGQNTGGMLGQNDQIFRSNPTQLTSLSLPNLSSPTQVGTSSYSFVCAGNNISTAISSTNKLFVWGLGTQGQLGVNLTVARSSPVQISSLSHNLVNAGGTHITLVSTVSPQLILSTGFNNSGQLGLSDTVSRSSPTQVAASATAFNSPVTVSVGNYSSYYVNSPTQIGSSSWTTVSAGGTHTIATKKDNTLFAWGLNNYGQLGGSNTINTSSPVQIGTSSWSQVSAGDLHNTISKSDGTINTFGLNNFGQLGDGT